MHGARKVSVGYSLLACAVQIVYLLGGIVLGLRAGAPGTLSIAVFFAGFFLLFGLQVWVYRRPIRRQAAVERARAEEEAARRAEENRRLREIADAENRKLAEALKAREEPRFHSLIEKFATSWDIDRIERHIARAREMERDPAARRYLSLQMAGQWVSDLEVRYWDNPNLLVTCEHMRPVEARVRAEAVGFTPGMDDRIRIASRTLRTGISGPRLVELAAGIPDVRVVDDYPWNPHASGQDPYLECRLCHWQIRT